ncbi:MAG: hypothetical protein ACRDPC_14145 [Solirubrobacteraceae bacterium]
MIAYKFLRSGAVGPFSGRVWPVPPRGDGPAEWVEIEGPLELCVSGVHACTRQSLSGWLDEELWAVELAGELDEAEGMLLARRGRLVSRVEEWPDDAAAHFARTCVERATQLADRSPGDSALAEYAADAERFAGRHTVAGTALAAYASAVAAEAVEPGGFIAERGRQSEWLASRLRLEPSSSSRM